MSHLSIEELPYSTDSQRLFARIADMGQPVFLDSAFPYSSRGRYDILSARPCTTVTAGEGSDCFDDIRAAMAEATPAINNDYHLPFLGGAIGFFSYDLGRSLETLPDLAQRDIDLPAAAVGIYTWAIIVDHRQQRSVLVAHPSTATAELREVRQRLREPVAGDEFALTEPFRSNFTHAGYQRAFEAIQHYIHAGDCYQINLAQRFSAGYTGSPRAAYQALRKAAAAPYSAYLETGDHAIVSLSPERLLHVANRRVTTSPIKGTRKRGATLDADHFLARQLLNSSKDRAENLMIVDLLRNDLGKACTPGSIQVDQLFELQSFETVHHLVSTISGQLRPENDALAVLAGCFPGGSITGAPKVRAMQIIEELEPHRRSVYCGAIGYLSCDGQMDTNIAIRTLICDGRNIHCWAGGGIVADSECESEYEECWNKVGGFLKVLEGLRSEA